MDDEVHIAEPIHLERRPITERLQRIEERLMETAEKLEARDGETMLEVIATAMMVSLVREELEEQADGRQVHDRGVHGRR